MLRFDFNNVRAERVGAENGLSAAEWSSALQEHGAACAGVVAESRRGAYGFTALPDSLAVARRVSEFAATARDRFENFVVLGIGGSALGPLALHTALCHPFYNLLPRPSRPGPRFFVLDNIDPVETGALWEVCDPKTTLYNVITKSGTTAETLADLLIAVDSLERAVGRTWREHLVATTDPARGLLREFAKEEDLATFAIPPDVGGRFSVFTPVGLLPAAMCGIDIETLLGGARTAASAGSIDDPSRNPAFISALVHHLLDQRRGKHIAVMMAYAESLYNVADWFRQLWAESLGKRVHTDGSPAGTGPTPVKALGATDQHSQIQLYAEGPNDKFVTFLGVDSFAARGPIPTVIDDPQASYLGGRSLEELIHAEQAGTAVALTDAGRPNATISLAGVNAASIGALLYLFEMQTVFAGRLYRVDPFDQPGVEAGKVAAFALMGRAGHEARAAEIRRRTAESDPNWTLTL